MKKLTAKLYKKISNKKAKANLNREIVETFAKSIMELLFPQTSAQVFHSEDDFLLYVKEHRIQLMKVLKTLLPQDDSKRIMDKFFEKLPEISDNLDLDMLAMLEGDPAANCIDEIVLCYPGFLAITFYRIANFFHKEGVPVLPRMLSEHAHSKTGIDIHPGATIGKSFCIDHGTGVVIGETTVIGNHVKIYQGVTLGALSVDKRYAKTKRHPTIEDGCVIYSNATLLGGDTIIGKGSIVGGNVWITKSIPKQSIVYNKSKTKLVSQIKENITKKSS